MDKQREHRRYFGRPRKQLAYLVIGFATANFITTGALAFAVS